MDSPLAKQALLAFQLFPGGARAGFRGSDALSGGLERLHRVAYLGFDGLLDLRALQFQPAGADGSLLQVRTSLTIARSPLEVQAGLDTVVAVAGRDQCGKE